MLTLANDQLRIELLNPVADRAHLGPRFCWGGYIWQIHDAKVGALLSGPEWPKPDPAPFNGQGLPESFRHSTRDGRRHTWNGDRGLALGAGEIGLSPAGVLSVIEPCTWEIESSKHQIVFRTKQRALGFDYAITRTIQLAGRTVQSTSELTNHAEAPLRLEWFAHPFFPLTDRLIEMEVPTGSRLAENPGFALKDRTLLQKVRFQSEKDGHMDFLCLPASHALTATLNHPKLTHLTFETTFVPSESVIWANSNTFSIEPYQTLALLSGESKQWSLRYDFGSP